MMLTPSELQDLGHAQAIERQRADLYEVADKMLEPIALRLMPLIAALPHGGSFHREDLQTIIRAIEQFPRGFHRSELQTALNMKGPWTS